MDSDNSGCIKLDEFKKFFYDYKLNIKEEFLNDMFNKIDVNCNNKIEIKEFSKYFNEQFQKFDKPKEIDLF